MRWPLATILVILVTWTSQSSHQNEALVPGSAEQQWWMWSTFILSDWLKAESNARHSNCSAFIIFPNSTHSPDTLTLLSQIQSSNPDWAHSYSYGNLFDYSNPFHIKTLNRNPAGLQSCTKEGPSIRADSFVLHLNWTSHFFLLFHKKIHGNSEETRRNYSVLSLSINSVFGKIIKVSYSTFLRTHKVSGKRRNFFNFSAQNITLFKKVYDTLVGYVQSWFIVIPEASIYMPEFSQ